MRTVTFQSVLWGAARLLGLNPVSGDLNSNRAATLTEYVNSRVKEGWEYEFWPELTPVEQRYLRDLHDITATYAAPTASAAVEVFFAPSGKCYQALQSNTGQYPALLAGGVYVENGPYWAECRQTYLADATWATGLVVTVGMKVLNPADGRTYQAILAHTAGATFDGSQFGILTAFDPYIADAQTGRTLLGEVKQVCQRSPRVFPRNPMRIWFGRSDKGIQVRATAPPVLWVEFRLRPNVFTSTPWSNTVTYGAGSLVYSPTTGECYASAQAGNLGHAVTAAAWWTKVDFPAVLAEFVKRAVASDGLRDNKQTDRAKEEEERAQEELDAAVDRAKGMQAQWEGAAVDSYGGN